MEAFEKRKIQSVLLEVAKGEADVLAGKTYEHSTELLDKIAENGKNISMKKKLRKIIKYIR